MPNLETYLRLLEPEMLLEKQKNEMKRHEAWRVYGALLVCINKIVVLLSLAPLRKLVYIVAFSSLLQVKAYMTG